VTADGGGRIEYCGAARFVAAPFFCAGIAMKSQRELGVIFDMDGVLVDSADAHWRSWRQLAEELGASDISRAAFQASFGRRSAEIVRGWFAVTDAGELSRLDARKEELYRTIIRECVPAMPGAVKLIEALHAAGALLAVGSSGPRENVVLICEAMGVSRYFSVMVTGEEVHRGKPDPEVFLAAAHRLGLAPEHCVVVEDAPAGVEAARRAGMRAVGLSGLQPAEALSAADLVVDRLDRLSAETIFELVHPPG